MVMPLECKNNIAFIYKLCAITLMTLTQGGHMIHQDFQNIVRHFALLCIGLIFFQTGLFTQTINVDQQFLGIRNDLQAVDKFSQEASIGDLSPNLRQEMEDILLRGILQGRIQRANHLVPAMPSTNIAVLPSSAEGVKGRFDGFTGRISFVSFLDGTINGIVKIRFETPLDVIRYHLESGGFATEMYISFNSLESVKSDYHTNQQVGEKELVIPLDVYDIPYGHESIHRYIGLNILPLIIYEGDTNAPLTFVLLSGRGLVYLCGKGRVSLKDEKGDLIRIINLPKDLNVVLVE